MRYVSGRLCLATRGKVPRKFETLTTLTTLTMKLIPSDGSFRVVYGSGSRARFSDFRTIDDVLSFVRCYIKRHPNVSIGDSWHDDLTVFQFRVTAYALEPRDVSDFVREVVA